jgi:hypothetical protein
MNTKSASKKSRNQGKPFPTIYDELKTAFEKPRIEDLLDDDWSQIEHWLLVQIERAKKK